MQKECPLSVSYTHLNFTNINHSLKLRVLEIQLSNGEIEHLVTNILDSSISLDDFKWIYQKRWGIETKYNDVKNKLEIENFTGYSPKAILQDFYATMFLANLAGVLEYDLSLIHISLRREIFPRRSMGSA